MQFDFRSAIDRRLAWRQRALLLGVPLLVWGLILGFALIASTTSHPKKDAVKKANVNLQLAQDRCTFLKWKSKEFTKTGRPSLRIDAQKAIFEINSSGEYEEKLERMRAICPGPIPSTLLVADCERATYGFAARYLTAQNIQWSLLPQNSTSLNRPFFSPSFPLSQSGFGECRNLKAQFQLSKPRFEAVGFSAQIPSVAKSPIP